MEQSDEEVLSEMLGFALENLEGVDMGDDGEGADVVVSHATSSVPVRLNGEKIVPLRSRPLGQLAPVSPEPVPAFEVSMPSQDLPEDLSMGSLRQLHVIERAIVESNSIATSLLETESDGANDAAQALRAAKLLLDGDYGKILAENTSWLRAAPRGTQAEANLVEGIPALLASLRKRISNFVAGTDFLHGEETATVASNVTPAAWRAALALWTGAACLNLFLQANYTGPELSTDVLNAVEGNLATVLGAATPEAAESIANAALAVDGELPYSKSQIPTALLVARAIIAAVSDPEHDFWTSPVSVEGRGADNSGTFAESEPVRRALAASPASVALIGASSALSSAQWWNGRCVVTHQRLLLSRGRSETLWAEAVDAWRVACYRFGGAKAAKSSSDVSARVWLEWGLAQHHFEDKDKGRRSFERAREASGLTVELTGAMGRRTKFQQKDLAQLVLVTKSATETATAPAASSVARQQPQQQEQLQGSGRAVESSKENVGEPTRLVAAENGSAGRSDVPEKKGKGAAAAAATAADQLEVGKTLARPVNAEGDEAAPRIIGHAADSHLLEEGVIFAEAEAEAAAAAAAAHWAPEALPPTDAAIVLALCLDVENSNPNDGLTNEQMTPYISRVLAAPGNWMVYSTALLQRAWVEFVRSHTRERAALQLQALLDQHTTKLTFTQASFAAVEEAAKAPERLALVHALMYPPRWELKRDLANKYAALGVLISAAQLFEELELWDEVVECYQQAKQEGRAEAVVRARLAVTETPQMWAALGDLTKDASCYERAWTLSNQRLARAQTALGRLRLSAGDVAGAIAHLEESTAVRPLQVGVWFTLGACYMRLEDWGAALSAFTRAVQLDPEQGEAWGNVGAVHMRRGEWPAAVAALAEGLKQNRGSWRMWENYLTALLNTCRWGEAIYALHRLFDLREKSEQPVDIGALAILVDEVPIAAVERAKQAAAAAAAAAPSEEASAALDAASQPLAKQLLELMGRVTGTVRSDARLWDLYARLDERLGRDDERILGHRIKQCRALMARAGWEKDESAVTAVADCSERMLGLWFSGGGGASRAYEAKAHFRSCIRRVEVAEDAAGGDGLRRLKELAAKAETLASSSRPC